VSGLAGLLAGHHPPGVYQWHAAVGPEDVRHAVEKAGARFAYVDGWTHQGKSELLEALADALAFPESFGHNFDALADCLRDIDGDPLVLLWDGGGPLARSDRRAFDVAADILAGRTTEGRSPMSVLLRGEGPEIDVPSLDG
jgi:RNAse (barnase) inhibitor barstar